MGRCPLKTIVMSDKAISVDPYVLTSLMSDLVGHDRSASSYVLYLALWQLAGASPRKAVTISLRDLAACTGLSKSAVQRAVSHLRRRGLISTAQENPTSPPKYTVQSPWLR